MPTVPKISVVMAVYNSAPYLRQALASIRWQTFTDWECICVNDGSTDASASILRDFAAADARFRIFDQANAGVAAALNRGDAAARAPWIARMDSDDVALPQRLAQQWKYVNDHPETVVVGGQVLLVDPAGLSIAALNNCTEHDELEHRLIRGEGGTFAHPTLLMSRAAIMAAGQYREKYHWAHDTDLLLRLVRLGRVANIPELVLLYRQHPKSFCATRREQIRDDLARLLAEVRAERNLPHESAIEQRLTTTRRRTSVASKWARQAARAGNYRTAAKYWWQQASHEPMSLLTARTSVELAIRVAESCIHRRSVARPALPDWRQWDCPPAIAQGDLAA